MPYWHLSAVNAGLWQVTFLAWPLAFIMLEFVLNCRVRCEDLCWGLRKRRGPHSGPYETNTLVCFSWPLMSLWLDKCIIDNAVIIQSPINRIVLPSLHSEVSSACKSTSHNFMSIFNSRRASS